jgi:hypothetical protein
MEADRVSTDPLVRVGIVKNIAQLLVSEYGTQFATEEELESFFEDYILLTLK